MTHLFVHLPSFATDYSGAASVLYDLGGLVVIHEPSGCMGNFTGFDEPRWFHAPRSVLSSFIRENETIFGDDSILIDKILHECRCRSPLFVAVLGTPVPALIGCDVPGIAAEVAEATGLPAFGLNTAGFEYYQKGIASSLLVLEERFMDKSAEIQPGTVNILGYTPLDFSLSGDDVILKSFVHSCGYQVLSFLSGDGLERTALAPGAEKNIVVSAAALPLAEKMWRKYKIPYYAGLPAGRSGRELMKGFLQKSIPELPKSPDHTNKALIIGEQVLANAIRNILMLEFGFLEVKTATFFAFYPQLAQSGDVRLSDEMHLHSLIHEGEYSVVIGDPLFHRFISPGQVFIPLPHPAVSSKLHWNSYVSPLDMSFLEYISEYVSGSHETI
jgi:hypothetical protein